jgi:hypothetical protein
LVTTMFARKKSAATRNFFEVGWHVLRNFDWFFVDDIVFCQKLKSFKVCDVVFPVHKPWRHSHAVFDALHYIPYFFVVNNAWFSSFWLH